MNKVKCAVIFALMSNVFAMAQATEAGQSIARHQITVQGSGVFTRKVTVQGVTYRPTSSGGGMVGYRFNFSRFLGAEVEYDFFRNTQKFETSSTLLSLRTNVHAATGSAVINLPIHLRSASNPMRWLEAVCCYSIHGTRRSFPGRLRMPSCLEAESIFPLPVNSLSVLRQRTFCIKLRTSL